MPRRTAQESTEAEPQETVTVVPADIPEPGPQDAPQASEPEGKRRKPLAPLDFSAIHISSTVDEDMAAKFRHTKPGATKPRDEHQMAADDLVAKAHKKWVDADRPSNWAEAVQRAGMHLKVRADQWEPLKQRIQRAGTYHKVAIRFGQTIPSETTEGHLETVFYAKDKPVAGEVAESAADEG